MYFNLRHALGKFYCRINIRMCDHAAAFPFQNMEADAAISTPDLYGNFAPILQVMGVQLVFNLEVTL